MDNGSPTAGDRELLDQHHLQGVDVAARGEVEVGAIKMHTVRARRRPGRRLAEWRHTIAGVA